MEKEEENTKNSTLLKTSKKENKKKVQLTYESIILGARYLLKNANSVISIFQPTAFQTSIFINVRDDKKMYY